MVESLKHALVKHILRPTFEWVGNDHFSDATLNNLGEKLYRYLNFRNGFFIELGANDGFTQSNTYYLEKIRGWSGILIEPVPHLYQQAVKKRPKSRVFHCACVAPDYAEDTITLFDANLMSIVKQSLGDEVAEEAHLTAASEFQQPQEITVPIRTLNSILEECHPEKIDFLSLDVEGYEVEVLRGLDLTRFKPQYMLIESFESYGLSTRAEIDALILDYYEPIEQMSYHDVFYRRRVF